MANPGDNSNAVDPVDRPRRPRGFYKGAAAAGAVAAVALFAAAFLPEFAPYVAALSVFVGVAVGATLMRRARDRTLVDAIARGAEESADRDWELSDIAEHYRANADSRRRAEAASAAKSQFLTHVSHELRTPLAGIVGLTEVLMETPLTAEQETFARSMRISGELMQGLVDDILDFAKIEAGRFDLLPKEVDLEDAIEEVAELFFSRAEAKGLDLATYVDPAAHGLVMVDPARLRQVLINLIGNALKFTERGGVAVTVAVDGNNSERLRVAVEDTGPGIAAEDAKRIFDEFERGVGNADGSGLGLAIAQRIVGLMGSEISVAERPGGGSVFSFSLPLTSVAVGGDSTDLTGKRVLIVAPDGIAPQFIAKQIGDRGGVARISPTYSQAAALVGAAIAAGDAYDLMLFDQRAATDPGAALMMIRESAGADLTAAILVSPGRHKAIAKFRGAGFDAYLVRPLRRSSLMRILADLVAGNRGFGFDPSDRRQARPPVSAEGSGLRVLLAEDDDINALLLRSMLLRQGHEITEVDNGEDAVAAAAEESFDVILLDLQMPKMSGIEAARAIRMIEGQRSAKPAKLMAVTADARPESRDAALAAGFDVYLQKPMTPDALRELLGAAKGGTAAA